MKYICKCYSIIERQKCGYVSTQLKKKDYDIGMHLRKHKVIFKSIISSHLNNLYIINMVYILSHISQKKKKKRRKIKLRIKMSLKEKEETHIAITKIWQRNGKQAEKTVIILWSRYKADRQERHHISAAPTHSFNKEPVATNCLK